MDEWVGITYSLTQQVQGDLRNEKPNPRLSLTQGNMSFFSPRSVPQWSSLFGDLPQQSTAFEGEKNHGVHGTRHREAARTDVGAVYSWCKVQKASSRPSMVAHAGIPTLGRLRWKDHKGQASLGCITDLASKRGEARDFWFEHVSQG